MLECDFCGDRGLCLECREKLEADVVEANNEAFREQLAYLAVGKAEAQQRLALPVCGGTETPW